MASAFISYSRRDIDFAKKLLAAFAENKLDTWIDWEGIPPSADWWKEIEKGIEEADVFIFLISPDGVKSKVNLQELEYAVRNGKRLIPIVVRDIKGEDAPPVLASLNWLYMREQDDFETSLRRVMIAINVDYDWVQFHRRLQVKALEWERNSKDNSYLLRGTALREAETQLSKYATTEPLPTDLQRKYVTESRSNTSILSRGFEAIGNAIGGSRSEPSQKVSSSPMQAACP